jgi:hypothetical protein
MTGTADLARYLVPQGESDLGFRQGVVTAWDSVTNENTILVAGTEIPNVPFINAAGMIALAPGDNVALLRYKSTLFILGKVVLPGSVFAQPQWPVILYPQFTSTVTGGAIGYAQVVAGTLASWEGRILPTLPKIEIDGIWGQASGSNTVTYELQLGGQTYGTWTTSGALEVARHGPFDISDRIGQDWLKVELKITSSTGTGQVAFQPLGVYFRQT